MAQGSGLSIDSDRIGYFLHHQPTVINSLPEDHHNRHYHHRYPPKWKLEPMEEAPAASRSSPVVLPATIQFPVNLNCCTSAHEDDPSPSNDKRTVINEMDFFAEKKQNDSKAASNDGDDVHKMDLTGGPISRLNSNNNVNTRLLLVTANTSSDQSMVDDGISPNSDDKRATKTELVVLQAEVERMKVENQRLREMLNHVNTNYNALQMHLMTIMQQQREEQHHDRNSEGTTDEHDQISDTVDGRVQLDDDKKSRRRRHDHRRGGGEAVVPRQFMDLGLAVMTEPETQESHQLSGSPSEGGSPDRSRSLVKLDDIDGREDGISAENGSNQDDQWGPNKFPRPSPPPKNVDQATEATMRKARVSVRARSEAPMITDGCQWRKYGQKMAKGNPCPRAYYRCTMAAGCPVRKQVQRCAEDRSILITTYEGNHNHPLPPAAMAMASTTSSAARMLLSGSMPSADGLMNPNFLARTLLPACSSSMATISASAPFPTVTLDLTQSPNYPVLQQFQRPIEAGQFHVPFQNPPPASLLLPQILGHALYNQSKFSGLQMSQDMINAAAAAAAPVPVPQQIINNPLADTVNALTTDPNFTAALAAAITSLIGGGHPNNATCDNSASCTPTSTSSNNNKLLNNNSSFPGKKQ